MNRYKISSIACLVGALALSLVGCREDAPTGNGKPRSGVESATPAEPQFETCSSCFHMFSPGTGKRVEIYDPLNIDTARKNRNQVFCKPCAPAYDRIKVWVNTREFFVRQSPWAECDTNGIRNDTCKRVHWEPVITNVIMWGSASTNYFTITNSPAIP